MAKEKDLSKLDKYFHHIYTVPGKFDEDRKYEELWCNNRGWKVEKLPTVSGTRATHCMVTETSFSKESFSVGTFCNGRRLPAHCKDKHTA